MTHDEKIVEAVAEALWQADSERAAGRRRLSEWRDESEETRNQWRFMARAAITAFQAEAWQGVELEAVLAAYETETRALPLGAANREKGDSTYNWRMSVVRDLRELAARISPPEVRTDRLGEMIYRALYEHEGGLWSAVDDRYKETVWNAAGRRLAVVLSAFAPNPPASP